MKGLLLLILLFKIPFSNGDHSEKYYLICTGKFSKSYHKDYQSPSEYCKGLRSCKADIERLAVDEARRFRSDPCDYCFGR